MVRTYVANVAREETVIAALDGVVAAIDETPIGTFVEIDRCATDAIAVLDALGVDKVHVVGRSMGGAIAAQMAQVAPSRVASLALLNSAGLGEEIASGYIEGFARKEYPGLKPGRLTRKIDASVIAASSEVDEYLPPDSAELLPDQWSAPILFSALNRYASSPSVMPCRIGKGK